MKARAKRAALQVSPSIGRVEDLHDAYISLGHLRQLVKEKWCKRWWTFHGIPTTVELPERRYAKLWDRFTDHAEDASAFAELLREYNDAGVPRPGGYADVFHDRHRAPRVAWSVNAMLAPAFVGGWQSALRVGISPGRFYRYDMRSAYLWAGSLGMPDTTTYRRSLEVSSKLPGIYRVKLEHPVTDAPYPFNRALECLASSDEIEVYDLPVKSVVAGVTWKRTIDPSRMLSHVRAVSTWKQAGRSYWGRWGQTERVECHAGGKSWVLPNIGANVPWAHMIVSRVKMKLWHMVTPRTVHVYIDSLITPERIPVGNEIGDWKLERIYENGVRVRGPGQYGAADEARYERMAGRPKDSPRRLVDELADRHAELLAG